MLVLLEISAAVIRLPYFGNSEFPIGLLLLNSNMRAGRSGVAVALLLGLLLTISNQLQITIFIPYDTHVSAAP